MQDLASMKSKPISFPRKSGHRESSKHSDWLLSECARIKRGRER